MFGASQSGLFGTSAFFLNAADDPGLLTFFIFQSFSQVDASTTRKHGGTGLGLAISKRLVEAMGGNIEVRSDVGKGSDFRFICRMPAADPSVLDEGGGSVFVKSGLNVLIVDDNDTNRLYLREVLHQWRCSSVEANHGRKALEILEAYDHENQPFDLILLDRQMPGMTGTELAHHVRELPGCATVPMVLLTSIHHSEADEWRSAGIALCLTKPIKKSYLLGAINKAVHGDSGQARAGSEESAARASDGPMRGTIVLVEDNRVNQKVALAMLHRRGLTVDVAQNGREAVAIFREKSYDLVLMDCQMPEMDGYEATVEIRVIEGDGPKTPIVAMTANALKGDRERCLEAGMNDYLAKPVKVDALFGVIEKWMKSSEETLASS